LAGARHEGNETPVDQVTAKSPGTTGASMCRQSATVCLAKSPTAAQGAANRVADRLAVLRDPRDRRGRRHSLVAVLLTAGCAVLARARSYLAIGQWVRHAPQDTLAAPAGGAARGHEPNEIPILDSTLIRTARVVADEPSHD
jgi:hypothetical protein